MRKRRMDDDYRIQQRIPYDPRKNPCTRDCPNRKAECSKDCTKWAKYVESRTDRYKRNKEVFEMENMLKPPVNRDKRGQY